MSFKGLAHGAVTEVWCSNPDFFRMSFCSPCSAAVVRVGKGLKVRKNRRIGKWLHPNMMKRS